MSLSLEYIGEFLVTNHKQSILSAVMDALVAHTVMSNQALDCQRIRDGLKEILLGSAQLYERRRGSAGLHSVNTQIGENARKERVMDKASKRVKRPMPFFEDKCIHGGIHQTATSAQSSLNCVGNHVNSR